MSWVTIEVDGVPRRVDGNATLAAVLLGLGIDAFRRDGQGAPRGPVCGMGTCHECRLEVDGISGLRSCLLVVREGMRVVTAT